MPGANYTYRIELTNGQIIYADDDDDACVHPVPRYAVGAYVHCSVGNGEWAAGRVVAHSNVEPDFNHPYPYQVKLRSGQLFFVQRDNEEQIRETAPTIAAGPAEHARCCYMGLAALAFEFDRDDQIEVTPDAQNCTLHLGWTESEAEEARNRDRWFCSTVLDRQVKKMHFCLFCDSNRWCLSLPLSFPDRSLILFQTIRKHRALPTPSKPTSTPPKRARTTTKAGKRTRKKEAVRAGRRVTACAAGRWAMKTTTMNAEAPMLINQQHSSLPAHRAPSSSSPTTRFKPNVTSTTWVTFPKMRKLCSQEHTCRADRFYIMRVTCGGQPGSGEEHDILNATTSILRFYASH